MLANGVPQRIEVSEAMSLIPLAEVDYVEATWVMVVKSLVIFLGVFVIVPVLTVVERKLIGRFQNRYGPNRVGPVGLVQPLADIVKLAGKEMFRPDAAVPFLYAIAPAIVIFSGIITLAILPVRQRPGRGRPLRDRRLDRRPLLLRLRLALVLRAAAGRLVLGLEVQLPRRDALGRPADLLRGLDGPVAARRGDDGRLALAHPRRRRRRATIWNIVPQIVGFLIFMVAGFAETNRAPFDLPEADAELVQGFMTEYGGMRFGSYLLAEYLEMFVVSGDRRHLLPRRLDGPGAGLARPGLDGRSRP